jgi:hypothetical protein
MQLFCFRIQPMWSVVFQNDKTLTNVVTSVFVRVFLRKKDMYLFFTQDFPQLPIDQKMILS